MINFFRKNKRKLMLGIVMTMIMTLMFAITASASGEGATGNGISVLGDAIDFVWTQFSKMAELVTSQPILLLPIAIFAAGAAIGLVSRLIR